MPIVANPTAVDGSVIAQESESTDASSEANSDPSAEADPSTDSATDPTLENGELDSGEQPQEDPANEDPDLDGRVLDEPGEEAAGQEDTSQDDPAQDDLDPSGGEDQATDEGLASEGDATDGDARPNSLEAPATQSLDKPVWLNDPYTNILLGVVLATLAIASLVSRYLRRQPTESINPALVRRFRQRLNAWWLMCAILVFGLLLQPMGTVVLFGLVSFWALREFITMAPTRRGDHRALFWALVVFTPLQYVLIGLETSGVRWGNGSKIDFYGLYSIVIPVYASLFVPARIAISGDHKRFLERSAQITIGLLICIYSLSYAPALINLELASSDGTPWTGSPAGLLFFFILVSQLADILQWTWGHLVGRRVIAPEVSASRTWEGFAGGTLSTGLIGAALFWVTPFSFFEAACMSMVIGVMGMFGGMTMSAIKRDRGVNDYGSLVMGHAGVLDRIDTLCFAAPVFYHLTRFFFTV